MSATYGRVPGTCQQCRKPVQTNGVGEVYAHYSALGRCPGSRCQSVETATPMTEANLEDLRAEWARMEGKG